MNAVTDVHLDDAVLERLAELVCGDDDLLYRRGFEIVKFFRAAGWDVPGEVDIGRHRWTVAQIQERRGDGAALIRLILRLADRRTYVGEEAAHEKVLRQLGALLDAEGYVLVMEDGRPALVEAGAGTAIPSWLAAPIELKASLTDIVDDREFGEQLRNRLDEAHRCLQAGAPTAAIIMLGSVLEGVLYDVALTRHTSGRPPTDHLQTLIDMAVDRRWISKDAADYAHVVRDHRNLVHPKKQRTQAYAPAGNSAEIAWKVVVLALNNLQERLPHAPQ